MACLSMLNTSKQCCTLHSLHAPLFQSLNVETITSSLWPSNIRAFYEKRYMLPQILQLLYRILFFCHGIAPLSHPFMQDALISLETMHAPRKKYRAIQYLHFGPGSNHLRYSKCAPAWTFNTANKIQKGPAPCQVHKYYRKSVPRTFGYILFSREKSLRPRQ